ncbi:MAG TPA: YncE family protein [Bryobacteraceae bacterium]|nr:YncE family protein [Bryobacteraceae bacterium]
MKTISLFLLTLGLANADSLLVLSKGDLTLAIVDPSTLKVVAKMPSGPDPHEVAASADGKTAYISNYGGGAYNTITVVDLIAQKTTGTIDLGALRGPHGLMFVGGKLWFTAEGAKIVGSYDPATNKVDTVIGTGQGRTHMVYTFDDSKRLITSNVSSATMTIIDKTTGGRGGVDWNETTITVGPGAEGFDVAPGGKELWAANAGDGTISIIDLAAKKVTATLDANVKSANRLKITPDGKLALVSMLNNGDLAVFDVATRKLVKRIPMGRGAAGIEIQPDGSRAFVACTPDSYVVTIDLKSLTNSGKFDAGKNPDGMAWVRR